MTLLSGIISSAGVVAVPNLNTTLSTVTSASSSSTALSITGASNGQLYILLHAGYNPSGISTAPATPSGFTSLSSYAASGSIVSFRLSYKILTSNESTYTLPSVSGATAQTATAVRVSTLSGTFTGLSLSNSSGYSYGSTTTISNQLDYSINDIGISLISYTPATPGGGSNFPTPSASILNTDPTGTYWLDLSSKAFDAESTTGKFFSFNTPVTALVNLFNLTATFS